MGRYLIDNNVVSNYFLGVFSGKSMRFLADVINNVPCFSVITKIEALSWRSSNVAKEDIVRRFVNSSEIIALSDTIVEKCIEIRRSRKIKTPDAIIAATAIDNNFTLLTSDSDFNHIPSLKVINPFDL